ncbi:hypothetical protein JCM17960_21460 [Magnetospira thiophila]
MWTWVDILRGMVVGLALGLGAFESVVIAAPSPCNAGAYLAQHRQAVDLYQDQKFDQAVALWAPLAEVGFAPAQARYGHALLLGEGADKNIPDALFWTLVAARQNDLNGMKIASNLQETLDQKVVAEVTRRAETWQAEPEGCMVAPAAPLRQTDSHTAELRNGPRVVIDPKVSEEAARAIFKVLASIATALHKDHVALLPYLALIDRLDIFAVPEDPFDRYVGWAAATDQRVLQMSVGSFMDDDPNFMLAAILLEVRRHIYDALPQSHFNDPQIRTHKGVRLVGSVYDDINNKNFYKMASKALDMAEKLPKSVAPTVQAIHEIRYNPQSRHFFKTGRIDATGGYFMKHVGGPDNRIITVRREARWVSPASWLLLFVHEGTHILQQQKAERHDLKIAQGSGTTTMSEYNRRWRQGVEMNGRQVSDMAFECEATENEIRAARALDLPPSLIEESGYLSLCDRAQKMMVQWSDARLAKSRPQ